MRFSRILFHFAALYGLLVLVPGLFSEPADLSHPEYYYGFFGSALVWQGLFFLIARDPLRYRPLMIIAVLEKAAFFLPCLWLYAQGRMAAEGAFFGGLIDGVLMLLFAAAWVLTGREKPAA